MGAVYEAQDLSVHRRVALKVLYDTDAKSVARFRQEAAATAQLQHPHVAAVYGFFAKEGEPPFFAMDLLEGPSLRKTLDAGPLPAARAVAIAIAMLDALEAAHRVGVIHRDIKPSNVVLTADGVKLVDFGIAKVETGAVTTTTGTFVGTPGYAAPEQITGETVDARTDVFATGLCLFEMLAGTKPWRSRDATEMVIETLQPARMRVREFVSDVSPSLDGIVARAIAREPSERFPTASAMRATLAAWRPEGRRGLPRGAVFALAALLPLAAAAVALPFLLRRPPSPPPSPPSPVLVASVAPPPIEAPDAADILEPDGSADVPSTPSPAVRVAPSKPCLCAKDPIHFGSRVYFTWLCPKHIAVCRCFGADDDPLCAKPIGDDGCGVNGLDQREKEDVVTGRPCVGYGADSPRGTAGTYRCTHCNGYEARSQARTAVPGTPCTGYTQEGELTRGAWIPLD